MKLDGRLRQTERRPRTLHLRHSPRWSGLRRLCRVPPTQAGLTRTSQRDRNKRGAGRHHGPAPRCVFMPASISSHRSLSPLIRPSRGGFVPTFARFVPACARFVPTLFSRLTAARRSSGCCLKDVNACSISSRPSPRERNANDRGSASVGGGGCNPCHGTS